MTHCQRVIKTNKGICGRDHVWLAKPRLFTIWPFRRRKLLALGLSTGNTTRKNSDKNSYFQGASILHTSILHRLGFHFCYCHLYCWQRYCWPLYCWPLNNTSLNSMGQLVMWILFFNKYLYCFDLWLGIHVDTEGWLYAASYTILYRRLEHLWGLVSVRGEGILEPMHCDYWWGTSFGRRKVKS